MAEHNLTAYFIGGPEDLVKRVVQDYPPYYSIRVPLLYTTKPVFIDRVKVGDHARYRTGMYRLAFRSEALERGYLIYEWEGWQ